jgi:hypothetical protein
MRGISLQQTMMIWANHHPVFDGMKAAFSLCANVVGITSPLIPSAFLAFVSVVPDDGLSPSVPSFVAPLSILN